MTSPLFCLVGYRFDYQGKMLRPMVVRGQSLRLRERMWALGCSVDCLPLNQGIELRRAWQNVSRHFRG